VPDAIQLNNYNQVLAWTKAKGGSMKDRVETFVFSEALEIMAASKKIVPVKTGALRGSGRVEPPKASGSDISVMMVYGGPAAPYAFKVHEDHPTKSKFLERPADERLEGFQARMKAALSD